METFSVLMVISFVRGIHRSPVNSPHKGQWRGALMFSLICAWLNGWVNNREASDLRRHGAHYDVIGLEHCIYFAHINSLCGTPLSGPVTPYGDSTLGQIWHQARTNVDLLWKSFCGIHMRAISQEIFMNFSRYKCSEITLLKLLLHVSWAND